MSYARVHENGVLVRVVLSFSGVSRNADPVTGPSGNNCATLSIKTVDKAAKQGRTLPFLLEASKKTKQLPNHERNLMLCLSSW